MKSPYIIIPLLLLGHSSIAQNQLQLDENNVNITLGDFGVFCNNSNGTAGYEIPKGSGNHVNYLTAFWLTGIESDETMHQSCNTFYSGFDFFPGPVADDYNSLFYTGLYDTAIWKITRDQINYHVGNFTATGYIPDPAISNWPANGNVSEGIVAHLAPFVDVNGDQFYNPYDGDFPFIQGDAAVFVILNDVAQPHTSTTGIAFGVEIHATFYQYASTDNDINNTTFLNVKIFNRSDTNYTDIRFGLFLDPDIGNATNDYIGSDSALGMAYAYNGESFDSGQGGQPGYGTNPPAFGVKLLNNPAGSIYGYNVGGTSTPGSVTSTYMLMQGVDTNGTPFMQDPNPTKFIFTGNPFSGTGWTETNTGNSSGDRRMLISSLGYPLPVNGNICFDYAFVTNYEGGNALENINELLTTADIVQNFYNDNIQPCNQIFLAKPDNKPLADFLIYPNPSNGNFTLQISNPVLVSVFSASGDMIVNEFQMTESGEFNLNLPSGIYFLQIKSGDKMMIRKLIVY